MSYPPNWPRCPHCGKPALDGHITCGSFECDEHGTRRARDEVRLRHWVCAHCRAANTRADTVYVCGNCGLPR